MFCVWDGNTVHMTCSAKTTPAIFYTPLCNIHKVCKWPFRPSHWQRITATSNVYFSKIQLLIQSFSGNESNRSLWVEEIAFPELHFTAWCWIHSSGSSFRMFHHRLDPRGWYNPLITHTCAHAHIHPQWGAFASCMWGIWESIIYWGSDLIAYSMWEDTNMIECQAKQRQSPWYVRIALEVSHYHFLSRMEG